MADVDLRMRARTLQKVVNLCVRCLSNLAFYRTGWNDGNRIFFGEPYRQINANFYDHIYLEWCKLFGARGEEHHWSKLISNGETFKASLLENLNCSDEEYEEFWNQMTEVRNRAVGHQDVFEEIPAPMFDYALQSVSFLLNYIYENEIPDGVELAYRYDPEELYELYSNWGNEFWNGEEPTGGLDGAIYEAPVVRTTKLAE